MRDFRQLIAQSTPKIVECGNDKMIVTAAKRHIALHGFTHYRIDRPRWIPTIALDMDARDPLDLVVSGYPFPLPAYVVYNSANGHSHAVWVLDDPVVRGPRGEKAEQTYWLVRDALQLLAGADRAHTNLITRTPYHEQHIFYPCLYKRWELSELLRCLPVDAVSRRTNGQHGREFDESAGWKCGMFGWLRAWAYEEARQGRYSQLSYERLYAVLEARNRMFIDPVPLSDVRSMAKSVDRWMQTHWRGNKSNRPQTTKGSRRARIHKWDRGAALPEAQQLANRRAGQAQGAESRREATREVIRQAVGQLVAQNQRVTRQKLADVTGLGARTLSRHADIWKR